MGLIEFKISFPPHKIAFNEVFNKDLLPISGIL